MKEKNIRKYEKNINKIIEIIEIIGV